MGRRVSIFLKELKDIQYFFQKGFPTFRPANSAGRKVDDYFLVDILTVFGKGEKNNPEANLPRGEPRSAYYGRPLHRGRATQRAGNPPPTKGVGAKGVESICPKGMKRY